MLQGVIFDLDGVLIDSEPANIQAGRLAFAEAGYAASAEDQQLIPGRHSADFVPIIIKNNNLALLPEDVSARCHELYQELWEDTVILMPAAAGTLARLKEKGLALALATSANRSIVTKFLNKFTFQDIFSAVVSADDVQHRKPNPEPYLKAAAALHLPPEALLVIEDTAIGITAAKAAGLRCAAIPNKHSKNQDVSQADYRLSSLNELEELVNQLRE